MSIVEIIPSLEKSRLVLVRSGVLLDQDNLIAVGYREVIEW